MKAHHKKKPFIISRQPSKKGASSNEDQQLKRALVPISQSDSNIELQNQILAQKTVYKNCYHLFKVNAGILPELLQRYADDNYKYRDEEFTQQANNFLMKISSSKKIPKDLRAKYPLYFILVSICKIFMLNEYEIVVLACALDHCNWKIEETVYLEEAKFLKEFPGELGGEIDTDCKRLIIYLLIVTFSLKQYLNDKGEVDKIHAYCESICTNFQAIFNRWTRIYSHKFNYSPVEINKKFRNLSTQEPEDTQNGLKDYNIVVDSIMNLTGSYKSKVNPKLAGNQRMPQIFMPQSSPFASIPITPLHAPMETNLLFPDLSFNLPQIAFERTVSRPKTTVDFDTLELPPELEKISRRTSSSHMPEDSARKKFKPNNGTSGYFSREESIMKDFSNFFTNNLTKGVAEIEDFFFNNPLPGLSKMSSTTSQAIVEEPNLFRFHSNMSSWNKE